MNIPYHLARMRRALLRRIPPVLGLQHLRAARDFLMEVDAKQYFGQFGEDAVLQGYFTARSWAKYGDLAKLDAGFFVDVGAYHPTQYSNTFWFYQRGWRGINIDPTPGTGELFRRRRPRDITLEVAISEASNEVTLYSWGSPFVVNTLSREHALQWEERLGHPPASVVVRSRRLDSVLDEHVPPGTKISFMNVDCENHDLEVIRSGDWTRYRPELVLVEYHTSSLEGVLESPIHTFMTSVAYDFQQWIRPTLIYRAAEITPP